jgi:hypothetical protein
MSGEVFTRRWLAMFALLAALIAASPLLIDLLTRNAGCFGTESACRDMAEVFKAHGRSWILILALIPLAVMIATRTLTVGLFAWAFPFALLMLAGALPLLFAIGGPEVAGWNDMIGHPAIVPLLFLLVLLVALSAEDEERGGLVWRVLMAVVAVAALFLTSAAWLPGFALMPVIGQAAELIGHYLGTAQHALGLGKQIAQLVNTCLLAFVLAAAGMMVSARARNAY